VFPIRRFKALFTPEYQYWCPLNMPVLKRNGSEAPCLVDMYKFTEQHSAVWRATRVPFVTGRNVLMASDTATWKENYCVCVCVCGKELSATSVSDIEHFFPIS
jgi:hypothetical protein